MNKKRKFEDIYVDEYPSYASIPSEFEKIHLKESRELFTDRLKEIVCEKRSILLSDEELKRMMIYVREQKSKGFNVFIIR